VPDLTVARHGRVALLTLDRPRHGNRLTTSLANQVAAVLHALRDDREALAEARKALLAALDAADRASASC
jgi:enoyl-CoA hydratase/carnithine racemase